MSVTPRDMLSAIEAVINELRAAKKLPELVLDQRASLLDGRLGIDSLDLAAIVVQLQAQTNRDPFAAGFVHFNTIGELARLFADAAP